MCRVGVCSSPVSIDLQCPPPPLVLFPSRPQPQISAERRSFGCEPRSASVSLTRFPTSSPWYVCTRFPFLSSRPVSPVPPVPATAGGGARGWGVQSAVVFSVRPVRASPATSTGRGRADDGPVQYIMRRVAVWPPPSIHLQCPRPLSYSLYCPLVPSLRGAVSPVLVPLVSLPHDPPVHESVVSPVGVAFGLSL